MPTLAALVLLALAPAAGRGEDLQARLEALRAEARAPALGMALVTADGPQAVVVTGTRRAGGTERVTAEDRWHLGSCTKSMTATVIALLVARGDLAWDALLGDLLPDVAEDMHLDYTDVTLVELLSHRAGVTNDSGPWAATLDRSAAMVAQRAAVARAVLALPPVHPPRGRILYSNHGYVVAGHVAEVATGKPWEELMQELLFRPLGMTSAGFGAPGTPDGVDQPRGHTALGVPVEPGPAADNPPFLGPAGTVHASLADWGRYVALHLRGARGDVEVGGLTLTRADFARLHAPYPATEDADARYALGWGVETRAWAGGDGTALRHAGSNTLWYCVAWLGPGNGVAALVTANVATDPAQAATDRAAALALEELARRRSPAPAPTDVPR